MATAICQTDLPPRYAIALGSRKNMSVIRAFIAINLTSEIQQRIDEAINHFKQKLVGVPVRWVTANNIHLTLKFLGDASVTSLEMLTNLLQAEVAGRRCFEISIGGAGAFPSNRRPRVIWVGVEAPVELMEMQIGIESAMARLGYAPEEHPFSPHLTLGRVARNRTNEDMRAIALALEAVKIGFLGAICVQEVFLYQSDLKPTGAVYTSIFTVPLGV
jgi:2'-5' RNA ligase